MQATATLDKLDETADETKVSTEALSPAPAASFPLLSSRDARDVMLNYRLVFLSLILALLCVGEAGIILYQSLRKADLIVIDDTSDKRIVLNNREVGSTQSVSLGPNRSLDSDKVLAASEYIRLIYEVDPTTRGKDIERALRMMVPDKAVKFSNYLTNGDGLLSVQKAENWQAVWTVQSVNIDARDSFRVNIIGTQDITRTIDNKTERLQKQFNLSVKLAEDAAMKKEQRGNPRAARNFNTGFLIVEYTGDEIKSPS